MSEEPAHQSRAEGWLPWVAAGLVFYALSVGPAEALASKYGLSEKGHTMLAMIYAPLDLLGFCEPLTKLIRAYTIFWDELIGAPSPVL